MARPIEIWNRLPGVTPVKVHESEYGSAAHQGTDPESWRADPADVSASVAKAGPRCPAKVKARKQPTAKATAPKGGKKANDSRTGTKTETVIGLLRREGGVTAEGTPEVQRDIEPTEEAGNWGVPFGQFDARRRALTLSTPSAINR
jgi:hypothetical protein